MRLFFYCFLCVAQVLYCTCFISFAYIPIPCTHSGERVHKLQTGVSTYTSSTTVTSYKFYTHAKKLQNRNLVFFNTQSY